MRVDKKVFEFEWDKGNSDKNLLKHNVSNKECEEAFFDGNKKIYKDPLHSGTENRFILMGATIDKRPLFVVFTARKNSIRIISARDVNKKEIHLYEKKS